MTVYLDRSGTLFLVIDLKVGCCSTEAGETARFVNLLREQLSCFDHVATGHEVVFLSIQNNKDAVLTTCVTTCKVIVS